LFTAYSLVYDSPSARSRDFIWAIVFSFTHTICFATVLKRKAERWLALAYLKRLALLGTFTKEFKKPSSQHHDPYQIGDELKRHFARTFPRPLLATKK
jgi:hypothetical protein